MPWTVKWRPEEDQLILYLHDDCGWTFARIAQMLKRGRWSVYHRYQNLRALEVSGSAKHGPR